MKFSVDIPVKIISGRGCVASHPEELKLGQHAAIVCGKRSAVKSGALGDVVRMLGSLGIGRDILDGALPNPPSPPRAAMGSARRPRRRFRYRHRRRLGNGQRKGGGAFAGKSHGSAEDLFTPGKLTSHPLPIVLIPTTAGTGSEANPYSVLTLPDGRHKKTYSGRGAWAKVAFLDPAYTESVSRDSTISTALDAMAHAMESYLSPKSDALSHMLALYAGREIWDVISEYPDTFTPEMRDRLSVWPPAPREPR